MKALLVAAEKGHLNIVKIFLEMERIKLNEVNHMRHSSYFFGQLKIIPFHCYCSSQGKNQYCGFFGHMVAIAYEHGFCI